MPRSDLTAAIARSVGTGLALVLPVAALVVLRLFQPLTMDPGGGTGWLAPIALGTVALCSAISVIPLLSALVMAGRLSAGAAGLSATALTAGSGALALAGPTAAATLPNSGLALTLVVVASGLVVAAWAGNRTLEDERSRWLGVIVALVLAETALGAALLAPGSELDSATPMVMLAAGLLAAGAAGAWVNRRNTMAALGSVTVALAAGLLAWARPGSVDALFAIAPLLLAPPLFVLALVYRGESASDDITTAPAPDAPRMLTRLAAPTPPNHKPEEDSAERDRLGREVRAALAELTDARHTIALQRSELERASEVDPLTGVASRSAIMVRLRDEVAAARRYPHAVSIVLMDVDGMGEINAQHGTAVGDAVLRELALRMRVRVREADAIGRVAGDSFLAILPHTDEKGATVFAEAMRDRATQRPVSTGRGEVSVTVSLGVTTMRSRQELTADTLLARADEAVASARAGGGNFIAYDRLHGLARLEERRPPETEDDKADQGREG
jgi:diguanylate cyclase (GGDEF)-like protein